MFVETQLPNGGTITEWVSPPPPPTHKTKGLNQTELRSLFTLSERPKSREIEKNIDDLGYSNPFGGVDLDVLATDIATEFGIPALGSLTYRQIMADSYDGFWAATDSGFDTDNLEFRIGISCQDKLGILDSPQRKDIILLGKPL